MDMEPGNDFVCIKLNYIFFELMIQHLSNNVFDELIY